MLLHALKPGRSSTLNAMLCLLGIMMLTPIGTTAQTRHELCHYDEFNSALQGHATQLLADADGLLWIATWNGLYRFDGYEFERFTPVPGDGCEMGSVRLRDIWLDDDENIICLADDGIFRFRLDTYQFCNITSDDDRRQASEARHHQTTRGTARGGYIEYTDARQLRWHLQDGRLSCTTLRQPPAVSLPLFSEGLVEAPTVRCLWADGEGRLWVSTKDDAALRICDRTGRLTGYVGPDGRLSPQFRSFGKPVYTIHATRDGSIWLGCKPGGLFRLSPRNGSFDVTSVDALADTGVYDLTEDDSGRLWVATLGDGLACIEHYARSQPRVIIRPGDYPDSLAQRVRRLHICQRQSMLIAATTDGLITSPLSTSAADMRFRRHIKNPDRPSSLSDNATTDLTETPDGRLFVSTETAGICEVPISELAADTLNFRHYNVANGLSPTDITQAMTMAPDGRLVVTGSSQVVFLDYEHQSYINLDHHFFVSPYRFSEARPLFVADRWLFGLTDGAITLPQNSISHPTFVPPLLLTAIDIRGKAADNRRLMAVATMDTLLLTPAERNLTIHFAALDYTDPAAVSYQFCIGAPTAEWTNLGRNHSITLPLLEPGTHQLRLRSTNANGQWTDNVRLLTIIAKPAFHETLLARILGMLLLIALVGLAVWFVFYTKSIERKQKETLQKYLDLLNQTQEAPPPAIPSIQPMAITPNPIQNDAFMQRVLNFVERNISNSDADIAMMAEACAVSRSVLQRRMKQLTGITPIDFLREARLQHACQILLSADMPVADVAYQCGFSDPKYFSRCFKQHTGLSPSDYRTTHNVQ